MTVFDARVKAKNAPLYECLSVPAQRGTLNIFWLGQAGFALRSVNSLVVIDPYLSDSLAEKYKDAMFKHKRMMAAPISPDELRGVDLLLATHAHSDHLDPGSIGRIMALNPDCTLICPKNIIPRALERGADKDHIEGMMAFDKKRFGSVIVEMLPSAHEELNVGPDGDTPYAGYIIEMEGMRLYHSGDCVPYDGLAEILRERSVDAAMLPVNGRDEYRRKNGVPGNFTVEEAAELCIEAEIEFLIPHHFGLFEFNTIAPEEIAARLDKYRSRGLQSSIPDMDHYFSVLSRRQVAAGMANGSTIF